MKNSEYLFVLCPFNQHKLVSMLKLWNCTTFLPDEADGEDDDEDEEDETEKKGRKKVVFKFISCVFKFHTQLIVQL